MTDVVIIKTLIGEEIIAEFVSPCHPMLENSITLSRPRVLQFHQDGNDMKTALVPWLITDPDNREVPMSGSYIVSMLVAPSDIARAYLSQVSGIQIAK